VAQIVSIQVGLPKLPGVEGASPVDCPWTTGFSKNSAGPVWLGQGNDLVGMSDLRHHGGPEKLSHYAQHYPSWQRF